MRKGLMDMTIREAAALLDAEVLCGEDLLDREIASACGSDMMSDVLAFVKEHSILLTGLLNPQVVRTAEMMDMSCIVFVRGKQPGEAILELARSSGIAVLRTEYRMYAACGKLYAAGLRPHASEKI
jgi:predicted transcriptional regulator